MATSSLPKKKTFTVISLFESGLADFDNNIAFINLDTLNEFFNLDKKDTNLEIYLKNPQNIEDQKIVVQKIFPNDFVYSWADMNSSAANLSALREKWSKKHHLGETKSFLLRGRHIIPILGRN